MESREEEEVVRRWKAAEEELDIVEERERARARERTGMGMIEGVGRAEEITTVVVGPGKKRRMIGGGGGQRDVVVEIDGEDEDEGISLNRNDRAGVTGGRKRKGRS